MFPSSDKPLLSIPDPDEDLDIDDEDEEDDVEKQLDIPPSWCQPITITHKGELTLKLYSNCSQKVSRHSQLSLCNT